VAAILTDPSVLFWNFANRANKLYKATEFEIAIKVAPRQAHRLELMGCLRSWTLLREGAMTHTFLCVVVGGAL